MSDPITLAVAGAGIGAMLDKDQPLRGATLGGMGGFAGGSMLGAGAAAGSQAGMTGAGGYLGSNLALPTLGGAAPSAGLGAGAGLGLAGQGAASAAAPGFLSGYGAIASMPESGYLAGSMGGLSGGMGAAAPYVPQPGIISQLRSGIPSLPGDSSKLMQAGQMMQAANPPPPQQAAPSPVIAPPMPRPAPTNFSSPYQRQAMNYAQPQPSILPGFRS